MTTLFWLALPILLVLLALAVVGWACCRTAARADRRTNEWTVTWQAEKVEQAREGRDG